MIVLAVVVYVFLIVLSLCRVAADADRAIEAQRYERRTWHGS